MSWINTNPSAKVSSGKLSRRHRKVHVSCTTLIKGLSSLLLTGSVDYDYLQPLYYINGLLAARGIQTVAELEAPFQQLGISEQQPSVPSYRPTPSLRAEPDAPEPIQEEYDPVSYQPADPFSLLEDEAGPAPRTWSIPGGPDSGFWSFEQDAESKPLQEPTLDYIDNAADNDDYAPAQASRLPVDSTLIGEQINFSPTDMFNDQAIGSIATEPPPFPGNLDDEEDLISHDSIVDSGNATGHYL